MSATDDVLKFPVMTELFGRPGVPMPVEEITRHEKPAGLIEDLIEQAKNAHNPVKGAVYAQLAIACAIQELTAAVEKLVTT